LRKTEKLIFNLFFPDDRPVGLGSGRIFPEKVKVVKNEKGQLLASPNYM